MALGVSRFACLRPVTLANRTQSCRRPRGAGAREGAGAGGGVPERRGDLTDAKTKDLLGSMQQKVEWQTYHSILKKTRVMEKTKWLDVKGNHDSFNVPSLESVENYYRKYSAIRTDGSFHYVHSTPFGNYSFISVDATLNPGPKRPYNFFGILDEKQMEELLLLSKESNQSNHTIWFGHYTTFTILSPSPGVRSIMSSATAYLCGHLHTLGGLMPVLHTRHYQGTLELEVGDWKNNRRVLAFSSSSITSVTVKIDGVHLGEATHLSGPIFTLKWNPRNYINSTHNIEVIVQDSAGRSKSVHHIFSLQEDNQLRFDPLVSFILLTDHCMVARVLFVLIVLIQLFVLIIYRHQRYLELKGPPGFINLTSFSLHVLSKINIFYYFVLFLTLYTVLVGIFQHPLDGLPVLELAAAVLWSQLQVSSPSRKILENYSCLPSCVTAVHLADLCLLLSSEDIWHSSFFLLPFADLVDTVDTCSHSSCMDTELQGACNLYSAVKKPPELLKAMSHHPPLSPRPLPQQRVEGQSWWASFRELLLLGCLGVGVITHY
ncbi:transmembrane protein 62 isoform X8 [Myotis lucifugus]|uniref:transmembrane protein 62 isoform X8 n=1 Tax=Myotis lucifugus TaxID=59463 RepID=UPI000CCBE98C|nr:transmembrane protein 62 isoform X8 [Myotis lucifugus]